ncbi:MAG: hypothetical protein AAGA87_10585 [Pseudomonadota bacterium]
MADTVINTIFYAVHISALLAPFAALYAAWARRPKLLYLILGVLFAGGVIMTVAFFSFASLGWLTLETGMESLAVFVSWIILAASAALSGLFYGAFVLVRKWRQ